MRQLSRAFGLVLLSAALPATAFADSPAPDGAAGASESTVLVGISGMCCAGCARGAEGKIADLNEVLEVKVDYASQSACLRVDNADEDALRGAIASIGYGVTSWAAVDTCGAAFQPAASSTPASAGGRSAAWAGAPADADIRTISEGEQVRLADHRAEGRYTVFDFSADWCAPCKVAAESLSGTLARTDDIAVRVVHLGGETAQDSYAQPVVAQHLSDAPGIPWFVVHSPEGRALYRGGDVNEATTAIDRHRERAARRGR